MITDKKHLESDEIIVDNEFVKHYFHGRKRCNNYYKALDSYYHMSFHFDGYFVHLPVGEERMFQDDIERDYIGTDKGNPYFMRLIDLKRPSESDEIKSYRRIKYQPFTKRPLFKVYNSLRKIVKAPDWSIDYTNSEVSKAVADDETLQEYCEQEFPRFNSVENWLYNYGIRQMLNDANGIIVVLPMEKKEEEDGTELYRPVPYYYNSKDVLDYKEDYYCVFVKSRKHQYGKEGGRKKGLVLGIVTKNGYYEAKQIDDKKNFDLQLICDYDFEYLNCFRLGGIPKTISEYDVLYDSFLSPMLPDLDEMASDASDFQAEKTQHIFNTMWYIQQQDCKHCMGTGKMMGKGKQSIDCSNCKGTGLAPKSPYRDMVIKASTLENDKIPIPPAGYITKPTEIVKLMMEIMSDEEYNALSAVNHEFLATAPLNTSGRAKALDRQEIQNFTYQVAYHCVEHILVPLYYFINEFRYSELEPNEEKREKQLPKINIPENFDFIDAAMQSQYMKEAIENKMDANIIQSMEMDYAAKNFPNNADLRDNLKLNNILNPLPKLTPEEKSLLLGKSITLEDVVISNYITSFVKRALKEDDKFADKEYDEQMDKMKEYAQEKIVEMNSAGATKVKAMADMPSDSASVSDQLGKIPLALQQLALARERANTAGDTELFNSLGNKMDELLSDI